MNRTRLFIILGAVVVIGGVIGIQVVSYFNSFAKVTLMPSNSATITIGPADSEGTMKTESASANSEQTVRLKKGSYAIKYSGNDYMDAFDNLNLTKATTVKTPNLVYKDAKLATLLQTERTSASQKALSAAPSGYKIRNEKLYQTGNWYGAILVPVDPSVQDILLVVLEKKDNTWTVAVTPRITIFKEEFPAVPPAVISHVENRLWDEK